MTVGRGEMAATDAQLLTRSRARDPEAFAHLVDRHKDQIVNYYNRHRTMKGYTGRFVGASADDYYVGDPEQLERKTLTPSPESGVQSDTAPPTYALKEGINTTFTNGQVWTLQGGKAVQVK